MQIGNTITTKLWEIHLPQRELSPSQLHRLKNSLFPLISTPGDSTLLTANQQPLVLSRSYKEPLFSNLHLFLIKWDMDSSNLIHWLLVLTPSSSFPNGLHKTSEISLFKCTLKRRLPFLTHKERMSLIHQLSGTITITPHQ